jgi:hypothetical protein
LIFFFPQSLSCNYVLIHNVVILCVMWCFGLIIWCLY